MAPREEKEEHRVTSSEPPAPDQPEPATPANQPGPPPPEMAEPAGPPADVASPASSPPGPPPYTPAGPPPGPGAPAGPGRALGMPRPGMVTGAAVTMIVLGALIVLLGLVFLIFGAFVGGASNQVNAQFPEFSGMAGAVAGLIIALALIFLAFGILDIVAGANVLGGRSWARITGIVLAAIVGLLSLSNIFGGRNGGGVVLGLIVLAANAFIIWALATTGGWFASRAT